jgi:hypothetical protein
MGCGLSMATGVVGQHHDELLAEMLPGRAGTAVDSLRMRGKAKS